MVEDFFQYLDYYRIFLVNQLKLDLIFYQDLLKFDYLDLYFVFDDQDLNKKKTKIMNEGGKNRFFCNNKPSLIALIDCVNGSSFEENSLIKSVCG